MKSSMRQSSIGPVIYAFAWVLIYSSKCVAVPVPVPARLDINRIIDPLQQTDIQYIDNTRRIKSVFNVPVLTSTPAPKCPAGTQRITSDGECTPIAPKISTDDKFLFNAIKNYYNPGKRPLPSKPNRRRTRPPKTTTTESNENVATEFITDTEHSPQTDPPFPQNEHPNSASPPSNSRPTNDPIVFEDTTDTFPLFSTTSFSTAMQTEKPNFESTMPSFTNESKSPTTFATFAPTTEMTPETTVKYATTSAVESPISTLKMTLLIQLDLVDTTPYIIFADTTIFPSTEPPILELNNTNDTNFEQPTTDNFQTNTNSEPQNVPNVSESTTAKYMDTNTEILKETTMNPPDLVLQSGSKSDEFFEPWTTKFQEMTTTFSFPAESE